MPSSNGSLGITIRSKVRGNIRTAAMMLFYILQENNVNKMCIAFNYLLPYIIHNLSLSVAIVDPTPYIRMFYHVVITGFRKLSTELG
jgi:hypothetical protein